METITYNATPINEAMSEAIPKGDSFRFNGHLCTMRTPPQTAAQTGSQPVAGDAWDHEAADLVAIPAGLSLRKLHVEAVVTDG